MIDKLNEQIESIKEVLDTLPKNNKKNINAYKEEITKTYNTYKEYQKSLEEEFENRKKKIGNLIKNEEISKIDEELSKMEENFYLLSNANTSYEKTSLDKYIYDLSKYYKYNLDKVNIDIDNITKVFTKNSISLTKENFYYSKYIKRYMESFFNHDDNLKDLFEELYWKCSDILVHAELNFKSLYLKNKSIFDKNIKLTKDNLTINLDKYYDLKKRKDILVFSDEYTIYNCFKNRILIINDFKGENIKNSYQTIFGNNYESIDIENVIKYYFALKEYTDYQEVTYIFQDAKNLLSNKSSYKSNNKTILKNIKKEENILNKINHKIDKFDKKNKDTGKLVIKQNNSISKLKELYDNLNLTNLLDRLNENIDSDKSFNEVLEIYYANYLYLVKLIKKLNEEISIEEINNKLDIIKNILLSPYKTFMEHTLIGEEKDIKTVFSDCYSLVSYNINDELLENIDEVNTLRENIYKIITYYYINKLNINILNIEFFCNS